MARLLAGPLPVIEIFLELAISNIMATLHLIAPARLSAKPTPCGNRPSRLPAGKAGLPAGKVRKIMDFWPFSVFARAARRKPLTLAITPARLCAWCILKKKELEMKWKYFKVKPQVTMASNHAEKELLLLLETLWS